MYFNEAILFQVHQMRSEVPVGELQHLLEMIEADLPIHHETAHDAQPYPAVEDLIQITNGILHLYSV